jgi:hypothetical protein
MELLGWTLALLVAAVIAAPFIASAIRRAGRRRRRRLVNSPRKIRIVDEGGSADVTCQDRGHARDGRKVRHDGGGGYVSVCKRCGAKLARDLHGTWHEVLEGAAGTEAGDGSGGGT